MKPLISKCSIMPAWHQLVPISGHVEESETARKLQLYATSIKTSVSTRLYHKLVVANILYGPVVGKCMGITDFICWALEDREMLSHIILTDGHIGTISTVEALEKETTESVGNISRGVGSYAHVNDGVRTHHHSTNLSWLPQTNRNRLVNIDEPHMTRYDLIFSLTHGSRLTMIDLHD